MTVRDSKCGVAAMARACMQAHAPARIHAADCSAVSLLEFYDRMAKASRPNRWFFASGVKGYKIEHRH